MQLTNDCLLGAKYCTRLFWGGGLIKWDVPTEGSMIRSQNDPLKFWG